MQLLTRLGFDTGYTPHDEHYNAEWRAGCEQRVELDLSCSTQHSLQNLFRRHFKREYPYWYLFLKPYIMNNVQAERSLSHRWPARYNNQVSFMQS